MTVVISPERAIADGISSESLILVAQWHQDRADWIGKYHSMSKAEQKKHRRPGMPADAERHERIALELRSVSARIEELIKISIAA